MENCYCGKLDTFQNCCQPLIEGIQDAISAEQLMRSRYSAYCTQAADYLMRTTHKSVRKFHKKSDILDWARLNDWKKLEIVASTETMVEFKAFYIDDQRKAQLHHEKSAFIFEDGSWFYVDGTFF